MDRSINQTRMIGETDYIGKNYIGRLRQRLKYICLYIYNQIMKDRECDSYVKTENKEVKKNSENRSKYL